MINVNEVFLSGNVVADAELRYTKTGKPVLTFFTFFTNYA